MWFTASGSSMSMVKKMNLILNCLNFCVALPVIAVRNGWIREHSVCIFVVTMCLISLFDQINKVNALDSGALSRNKMNFKSKRILSHFLFSPLSF